MMRLRGFEKISIYESREMAAPIRKTCFSAGYDIAASEDVVIQPYSAIAATLLAVVQAERELLLTECKKLYTKGKETEAATKYEEGMTLSFEQIKKIVKLHNLKPTLIPTGMKAYMQNDEVLKLFIRSNLPLNAWLILANGTGIIDADYYNNVDNEGHIFFQVINLSPVPLRILKGEFIGQGIFEKFLLTDNDADQFKGLRDGGFGSTTK